MEPAEEGKEGLTFVNEVKGGNIPKEFIPSVEKGFKEAMQNGVLAGYALEALKITLIDGSFHPVDSDALSFEMAAKIGYKEAAQKAKPVLLEPIMKLEVVTPEDFMGDIIADLNRRRGQVESMDSRIGARVITAKVPLAEQFMVDNMFTKKALFFGELFAFILGFAIAKFFFAQETVVRDGLQGVVINPEVPRGRARCGVAERTQGCVLYIMNPQRQELTARDFYDLASQLTGRQRFVIETGNMRYSNVKIRPGGIAQLNIPPLQ